MSMGILLATEAPPSLDADTVQRVMAEQKTYCAPSTWDRFVRSLVARGFPWPIEGDPT